MGLIAVSGLSSFFVAKAQTSDVVNAWRLSYESLERRMSDAQYAGKNPLASSDPKTWPKGDSSLLIKQQSDTRALVSVGRTSEVASWLTNRMDEGKLASVDQNLALLQIAQNDEIIKLLKEKK